MKKILLFLFFVSFASCVSVDCSKEASCDDYSVVIKNGLTTVTLNKTLNLFKTDRLNIHVILGKDVACFSIRRFVIDSLIQVFFFKGAHIKVTNEWGISVTSNLFVNDKKYYSKDYAIEGLLFTYLKKANYTVYYEKKVVMYEKKAEMYEKKAEMYERIARREYTGLVNRCIDKEKKIELLKKLVDTHKKAADTHAHAARMVCSKEEKARLLKRSGYEHERVSFYTSGEEKLAALFEVFRLFRASKELYILCLNSLDSKDNLQSLKKSLKKNVRLMHCKITEITEKINGI